MSQQSRRKMRPSNTHPPETSVTIPDKLYFRIGDVSQLCGLEAYVLRYWETEFPQLKPNKGGTGQRLYRKRDVEMVLEIKRLLYTEGFTIAGARRLLAERRRPETPGDGVGSVPEKMELGPPQVAAPSAGQKPRDGNSEVPLPIKPKAPSPPVSPQINDLRREMRELLSLLGADAPDRAGPASRPKRETRKAPHSDDEPTLFQLD